MTIEHPLISFQHRCGRHASHIRTDPRFCQGQRTPMQLPIHIRAKELRLLFRRSLRENWRSSQPGPRNRCGESCVPPRHFLLREDREDIVLLFFSFLCLRACLTGSSCPEAPLHVPHERVGNLLRAVAFERDRPHLFQSDLVSVVACCLLQFAEGKINHVMLLHCCRVTHPHFSRVILDESCPTQDLNGIYRC